MNAMPRSVQQLMHAMAHLGDLGLVRHIYFRQILPIVDVLIANNNSTGTIKGAVAARGVNVGCPRRPGSCVRAADREHLDYLMADIARFESEIDTRMTATSGHPRSI
jgi:dihydrodipicolinate synthase/N-acetylneuraminate lyase